MDDIQGKKELLQIYNKYVAEYNAEKKRKTAVISDFLRVKDHFQQKEKTILQEINDSAVAQIVFLMYGGVEIKGEYLLNIKNEILKNFESIKNGQFPVIITDDIESLRSFGSEMTDLMNNFRERVLNLSKEEKSQLLNESLASFLGVHSLYLDHRDKLLDLSHHINCLESIISIYEESQPEYISDLKFKEKDKKKKKRGRKKDQRYPQEKVVDVIIKELNEGSDLVRYEGGQIIPTEPYRLANKILDHFDNVKKPMSPEGMYDRLKKLVKELNAKELSSDN